MPRPLPPLNALRAFEAAARHMSLTKAASELHVTQAAVSHQVKALERHIGVALFRRLPRALLLTEAGQKLLPEPLLITDYDKEWPIWLKAAALDESRIKRGAFFDSTRIAVQAAIAGAGVAIGPPFLFAEDLAAGTLVQPFALEASSGMSWW